MDSQLITVHPTPVVTLSAFGDVCVNGAAFSLSGGSPAGGTYTGPGVTGNQFDPALAGVGTHIITYSFTSANGCVGAAAQTLQVVPLPAVAWNVPAEVCSGSGSIDLGTALPAGGIYTGPGMQGTSFDPVAAGVGVHTLSYTVTVNGCTDSVTRTVTVLAEPMVTLTSTGSTSPCSGDTILLSANGVGNLVWNTGETTTTIQPLQSGMYVVSASNACGVATDSIEINFVDGLELDLTGLDFRCPGTPVELAVQTNGQVLWSTGSQENVLQVNRGGTYWVQAFSTCDTLSDTITVRQVEGITLTGEMHPDRNNEYEFRVRPVEA
ncbi:MAG: hypothetical protein F6K11_33995, partial [Leptolyngbya sp. SIO3F4]|nr:hypothetical protein [Leptolyngbya sp. SIO3F4]